MTLLNQILFDLDEFIQREGSEIELQLLRSKLLLLHQLLRRSKSKTIIRGILNQINKMDIEIILIKLIDVINFQRIKHKCKKPIRKLNLIKMITPIDILKIFEEKSFPLKLQYNL